MKKLPVLIISVLLLAAGPVLFAGELRLGGEVGGNYAIFDSIYQSKNTTEDGLFYFDVLVPVEYRINERVSLATGLHWRADATRYHRWVSGVDSGSIVTEDIYDYTKVRHFLELPLTARLYLETGPVKVFIGAGGYIGLYLGTWQYGKMDNGYSDVKVPTFAAAGPESGDNLFTAGLAAELGAGVGLGPGELYLAARYSYGLTSLVKAQRNAANIYFSSITLNAGYTVRVAGPEGGAK